MSEGKENGTYIRTNESKKSRMTDMLIDGTISKEVYDEKVLEFTRKLHTLSERRYLLEESIYKQKDVGKSEKKNEVFER